MVSGFCKRNKVIDMLGFYEMLISDRIDDVCSNLGGCFLLGCVKI